MLRVLSGGRKGACRTQSVSSSVGNRNEQEKGSLFLTGKGLARHQAGNEG